jgi:hypothetical protein
VEEGRARYTVTVKVTLFRTDGTELETFVTSSDRTGRFERGVYGGDPQNLDLSRGERRIFDPQEQRAARSSTVEDLVADLAGKLAGGVFDRVLRRIP